MNNAVVWVLVLLMRNADNTGVTFAPTPGGITQVFSNQTNCELIRDTANKVVPAGTWLECQSVKVW